MYRSSAALILFGILTSLALLACGERGPSASSDEAEKAPEEKTVNVDCRVAAEGCPCESAKPQSCQPEGGGKVTTEDGVTMCMEGTRYCRDGVYGPCEDLHGFELRSTSGASALVDPDAEHQQCEDCKPNCFLVVDTLNPDDGPLDGGVATGISYHPSGGGVTLTPSGSGSPSPPDIDASVPAGSVLVIAPEGIAGGGVGAGEFHPPQSDVYLLLDHASSMTLEVQSLHSAWTTGSFLPAGTACVGGNSALANAGVQGAVECMVAAPAYGVGRFGDIPFDPYSTDTPPLADGGMPDGGGTYDDNETTYEHHLDITTSGTSAADAVADVFGTLESTGSPDTATSAVPALYSLATATGITTGLTKRNVPVPAGCSGSDFSYACFRDGGDPIVVLVTDSPMHNGPGGSYDYNSADLATIVGSGPTVSVPSTNDDFGAPYDLTPGVDASQILSTFVGNTGAPMTATIPADDVNIIAACGADDAAADAVFVFDVDSGSDPDVPITFSTAGTTFQTTLSIHDGPVNGVTVLPASDDTNDLLASADSRGDLSGGTSYRISGDTSSGSLSSRYQGSMFGQCGANSLANEAVFRIVNSSTTDPLQVSLDMNSNRGVLAVHDFADGTLPSHQWRSNSVATGNLNDTSDISANLYVISDEANWEYITLTGDTSAGTINASYDDVAFTAGTTTCSVDSASNDVVFQVDIAGAPTTLQFDTEGSTFDTVISLHDARPLSKAGLTTETPVTGNTDPDSAHAVAVSPGFEQSFTGDTSTLSSDVIDTIGCGLDNDSACGDAVYLLDVDEPTTVRFTVDSGGFDPGLMITRASPNSTQGQFTSFTTGGSHTCAVSGGSVYCWGDNTYGQLGDNTTTDSLIPVQVLIDATPTPLTEVTNVAAGQDHTCAVVDGGSVYCWGRGANGRLGNAGNGIANSSLALLVDNINGSLATAAQVSAGNAFSCALLADGTIACWGQDNLGQLGNGTNPATTSPEAITSSDTFTQVEAGHEHACAIRSGDRAVYCWGAGTSGRLGNGGTAMSTAPTPTYLDGGTTQLTNVTFVSAGQAHSCATLTDGTARCWGENGNGQLGDSTTTDRMKAVAMRNADNSADLSNANGGWAAGSDHSCITTLQGFVMCVGDDTYGQLGSTIDADEDGDIADDIGAEDSSLAVAVVNFLDGTQLVSNYNHTCALHNTGRLECWGLNDAGQLGDGSTDNGFVPVASQDGGSGQNVTFGDGNLDAAFTQNCRTPGTSPEPDCERRVRTDTDTAYYFCNDHSRTWAEAAQSCLAAGMELARPDEVGEGAWLGSQLDAGERAWLGVSRALDLDGNGDVVPGSVSSERDFVEYSGTDPNSSTPVYHHISDPVTCAWWQFGCTDTPRSGEFYGDYLAAGYTVNTWSAGEPSADWGRHCVQIDETGTWHTADCSELDEEPDNGSSGCSGLLGCLLGGLLGALLGLIGGLAGGSLSWVADLLALIFGLLSGQYGSPVISGGTDGNYVCEERGEQISDVELDPGQYYVTVKGVNDGNATTACDGEYTLGIQDLGSRTGGMLSCNDNGVAETTHSRITETFTQDGTYYVVLKGRSAGDEGAYNLTVRNTDLVNTTESACDVGTGNADPATVALAPNSDNYVIVKGDAPIDEGQYTLTIADPGASSSTLACDAVGNSTMSVDLATGTYYAVLKGKGPGESGDYQLAIGGASATAATFAPATYDDTVSALTAADIRVATVVTCDTSTDASCADARSQASTLANDADGVYLPTTETGVPDQVVAAIRTLQSAQTVRAQELIFAPDANPGFLNVSIVAQPTTDNQCTLDGTDPDNRTWKDCAPGATPSFLISLINPPAAPVAAGSGSDPANSYRFTLRLDVTSATGATSTQDIPVYVVPSTPASSGTYSSGTYDQSFDSRGCGNDPTLRPTWNGFSYEADVRAETQVDFYACTADQEDDLDTCQSGSNNSGYERFLTVSAGSGTGTQCTVANEGADCGADGYCNVVAGIPDPDSGETLGTCNFLEGADCANDDDCPGSSSGRCRNGPAVSGKTCRVGTTGTPSPASALGIDDGRPYMRMQMELSNVGDGSRRPAVFSWEMSYDCQAVE